MALDKILKIEVDLRGADASLKAFSEDVKKRSRINKQIALQLRSIVIRNFETESNSGTKWAKLKAGGRWRSTKGKKKRFLDISARILQDTGNLRNSFVELFDNDTAGVGALASAGVNYAIVHEKGSTKKKIPARPMLPTTEQVTNTAVRIYRYEIERAARIRLRT